MATDWKTLRSLGEKKYLTKACFSEQNVQTSVLVYSLCAL